MGKVEETRRAEGDDFSLRVFVGRRSAVVSANVFTDPSGLAERAVAMAKVAPEDKYAGLADKDRLAKSFPDFDLLDTTIPSAEELSDAALAAEDAARAVIGVTNSGGANGVPTFSRVGTNCVAGRITGSIPSVDTGETGAEISIFKSGGCDAADDILKSRFDPLGMFA